MPDLMEHMYCSQQINIPPNLPYILKQYAKAAIRTQPYDLLYWSAAYFRAKANNTPPPVKDRLEYPPFDSPSRLSPGFLKVLHKQLGENELVPVQELYDRWLGVCLIKEALDSMLEIGDVTVTNKVIWLKFVAVAAGHLSSSLGKTMVLICETLTKEPEGGSAKIPVDVFVNLYQFLARIDCGPETLEGDVVSQDVEGSITSHSTNPSTHSEVQIKSECKKPVEDKDSTTGLMVWQDLKPEEKSERMSTPKYTEDPGAPSEVGIEVFDNAQGPVQKVVTIFSIQPTKSEISIPSLHTVPSSATETGTNELSHTSLKENADWLHIEAKKHEKEELDGDKDLGEVTDRVQDKSDKEEEHTYEGVIIPLHSPSEVKDLTSEEEKVEDEITIVEKKADSKIDETEDVKEVENGRNSLLDGVKIQATDRFPKQSGDVKEEGSISDGDISALSGVEKQMSQDSCFEVCEKITKHFVNGDIEGSTVTYSSAEIRKGFVGEELEDEIERVSSENTIRAAETVQQIKLLGDESSESLYQEELDSMLKEPTSDTEESASNVCENKKRYIAGIGPVIPESQILAVTEYMQYWASQQYGCVMPRNINHLLCPPLDLPPSSNPTD